MRLIRGQGFDAIEETIHPVPNISVPTTPKVGAVDWWGWQQVRGGGFRSFLRWLLASGELPYSDCVFVTHLEMDARGECHEWSGMKYHYCETIDPEGPPLLLTELAALRETA